MKRLLTLIFSVFILIPPTEVVFAAPANYKPGVSYKLITPGQPTSSTDKIEVVELFWYGCPHCHKFQPHVERWLKTMPGNVKFVRMPATLRSSWTIHARAFYTAEALGVLDKTHAALFDAIHNKKERLNTEQAIVEFYAKHGVDKKDFMKVFKSFSVDSKVRRATMLTRKYGTTGTPSVVVNGKYRIDPGMANGNYDTLMDIVNFLVQKESTTGS